MSHHPDLTFDDDDALDALVAAFERGEAPSGGFSHQAHLAVALTYLARHGMDGATPRMRAGLLSFLERNLGDAVAARVKYKETITVFWLRLLAAELASTDPGLPLHERVNPLLARYRDASIIRSYYSSERLDSDEARGRFVEPDLRPLPDVV
jgi:hypothetical protein